MNNFDMPMEEAMEGGAKCVCPKCGHSFGKKKKVTSAKQKAAAKANPWLKHLAAFRKANPNVAPMKVAGEAKKTYKKKGNK
jgi:hypothetical protein